MQPQIKAWMNSGTWMLAEGHQIFVRQSGQGNETMLILHGYPYSSYEFSELITELDNSYRIVCLDLLGMGFSDKPREHNFSYEEHCRIIGDILKQLNIAAVHIFGHDLGVSISQELIARDAEGKNGFRIQSIAFVNGGLFMDTYKPRLIQRLLSQSPDFIGRTLSRMMSKAAVNRSVLSLFGPNSHPGEAFLDQQWDILNYKNGKDIAYRIGRLVFDKYNYQARWIHAMQHTKIPLAYICGPADPNSGTHMANRYRELIPNPRIYLLDEHIGHWPHVEDLSGTLKAYRQFRSDIEPQG